MTYCITRNMGRGIGPDFLFASETGMAFTHPTFSRKHERLFAADLLTARAVAAAIGNCAVVPTNTPPAAQEPPPPPA